MADINFADLFERQAARARARQDRQCIVFPPDDYVRQAILALLQGDKPKTRAIAVAWGTILAAIYISGQDDAAVGSTQQIPPSDIGQELPLHSFIDRFAAAFAAADADEVGYVHVTPVGCGMDNPNPDPMDAPLV